MHDVLRQANHMLTVMSPWEFTAVVFGIVYLLLAMRENVWCWSVGAVSTLIFTVLFYHTKLYMEAILQLYYVIMAIYGWWQWQHGGKQHSTLSISRWPNRQHILASAGIIVLSVCSSWILSTATK